MVYSTAWNFAKPNLTPHIWSSNKPSVVELTVAAAVSSLSFQVSGMFDSRFILRLRTLFSCSFFAIFFVIAESLWLSYTLIVFSSLRTYEHLVELWQTVFIRLEWWAPLSRLVCREMSRLVRFEICSGYGHKWMLFNWNEYQRLLSLYVAWLEQQRHCVWYVAQLFQHSTLTSI